MDKKKTDNKEVGSVIKLKNGYGIRFYLKDDFGCNKRMYLAPFNTIAEARHNAEVYILKNSHLEFKDVKISLENFLYVWFDYYKDKRNFVTIRNYYWIMATHIIPTIGHIKLQKLAPLDIINLYELKKKTLSNVSIRRMHVVLGLALKQAVNWDYLDVNIISKVQAPKIIKRTKLTLTEKELTLFLKEISKHDSYAIFYALATTGARVGEMCNLIHKDIDIKRRCFYITNAYASEDVNSSGLKNSSSKRAITMLPNSATTIINYIKDKKIINEYAFIWEDDGRPFTVDYLSKKFKKTIRKLGFSEALSLHSLRHTHASLLLKQGVHPKVVQERLGHSSISVTMDTYSHVSMTMQENSLKNVDIFDVE